MEYIITRDDGSTALYHYGVKGMKWGHRQANYYGQNQSRFKASNGRVVGAPNSRGVAAFRKVQATKAGGAMLNGMAKMNTALYGHGSKKKMFKNMERRIKEENKAVRESEQAHKQAKNAKKALDKQVKKNQKTSKLDNKKINAGKKILDNLLRVPEVDKWKKEKRPWDEKPMDPRSRGNI